ncbi:MAG: 1,4-dihydroxy-2-naphthoate polyprenyltransferase [Bdellovibrionales bacterium]|nr:1,4-dihydroxy-2-naphthoate polyprenyltransferase [Bdellovibrionales bacterium]
MGGSIGNERVLAIEGIDPSLGQSENCSAARPSAQTWLLAIRPRTLPAVVAPVLLGTLCAIVDGRFRAVPALGALAFGLGVQITTNLSNDLLDFLKGADTPQRLGPMRVTQSGLVTAAQMRAAVGVSFGITALLGGALVWMGGIGFLSVVLVSLLLALLYTGGPFPLAYIGLGDVFCFVFFGPVAVAATYFLQSHRMTLSPLLAGAGLGALSTAILVINNLRDYEGDAAAKKKTLVVRFGRRFGRAEYLSLLAIAAVLPFFDGRAGSILASASLLFGIPLAWTVHSSEDAEELNYALGQTALLTGLYACCYGVGLLLS